MAAWDREARVRREVEVRKGGFDGALNRLANPLAGKLRPEEEALVQERLEPEARRERQQRDHLLQQLRGGDGPPASDDEYAELLRRIDEQRRIQRKGRKTTATVVGREETGRTFATIPLVLLDFDIEGRAVRFEHVYGLANAAHYQVGRAHRDVGRPQGPGPDRTRTLRRMRAEGLEPPRLAAPAPKAGVSANSTTPAAAISSYVIPYNASPRWGTGVTAT